MASEQVKGSVSREQLLRFFDKTSTIFEQPEHKQRLADAARAGGSTNQDAVAVSLEIQGEVFAQMGIGPKVGLNSLTKVRAVYKDDRECILKYLKFVEREELAREEAEMGPKAFQQKMQQTKEVEEQQLKLLYQLRKLPADVQEGFLQGLQQKMQCRPNDDFGDDFGDWKDFYNSQQSGIR